MAETVYLLCAATSLTAAVLLLRFWLRTRTRLLLWSCLCFVGLAANNVLVLVDRFLVPGTDLMLLRTGLALTSVILLIGGLVWESR